MKTNPRLLGLSAFALTILAAACTSSSGADEKSFGSITSLASASPGDPVANLSGTWAFLLASSPDVAKSIRERCAKDCANDVQKTEACLNGVATQAAREKHRFTTDSAGHTVWTSFGVEGSKEVLFLEAPVELTAEGRDVLMKVTGTPKGTQAEKFTNEQTAKFMTAVSRIEFVDARTIAMTDQRKGRLVFSKE